MKLSADNKIGVCDNSAGKWHLRFTNVLRSHVNKDEVMWLAQEGQTLEKPSDIIKNPITLEFLGLKPDAVYSETKLENAIISKMQQFLLELGKGFLFEARQKRFTFDEQHFYVDLVFYNRLLQCYVLIDLKIERLTHQDLDRCRCMSIITIATSNKILKSRQLASCCVRRKRCTCGTYLTQRCQYIRLGISALSP